MVSTQGVINFFLAIICDYFVKLVNQIIFVLFNIYFFVYTLYYHCQSLIVSYVDICFEFQQLVQTFLLPEKEIKILF